jgi:hypothetical protein
MSNRKHSNEDTFAGPDDTGNIFKFSDYDNGHDDLRTLLNTSLDPSATDGHGHTLFGRGNSASGFAVQHNAEDGIEIGIKAHYRTGDDIAPSGIGKHGIINVDVPAGAQVVDPAHNVSGARPDRAAWNFDFSVDALGGKTLADMDAHLLIDVDPAAGTKFLDLHLVKAPVGYTGSQSGYVWETADTHHIVIGDDAGVLNHVSQNSFNFAFISSIIDSDPNTPGVQPYHFTPATFDVELVVNEKGKHGDHQALHDFVNSAEAVSHDVVADLHMQFHVVDHPLV